LDTLAKDLKSKNKLYIPLVRILPGESTFVADCLKPKNVFDASPEEVQRSLSMQEIQLQGNLL